MATVNSYSEVFGEAWDRLHPSVQAAHEVPHRATGRAEVKRSALTSFLATLAGLPKAGRDVPVELEVSSGDGHDVWRRSFGGRLLVTRQVLSPGFMVEQNGPAKLWFAVREERGRAIFESDRFVVFGLRMPRFLSPRARGVVEGTDDGWIVSVAVTMPMLGLICAYTARMMAV